MAKLIERPTEDNNEEEYANLNDTSVENTIDEPEESVEEQVTSEVPEEDDIPDKYRNKDIKEIVRMHQEAEKLLGRQSSEVGELRQIVDDFVKTQLAQKQSPQESTKEEEIDFFDDPDKYIERKLSSHPKIQEAEQYTTQAKQTAILNHLQQNHPDYMDIIQDEKFAEWVMASKVRQQLYAQADKQFNYDAADELLTLWKERQSIVQQTEQVQKQDRKNQVKAASTGSVKGSSEPQSRKIYRRADIIELMRKDPKRYTALSDDIMQAYAEGRVR